MTRPSLPFDDGPAGASGPLSVSELTTRIKTTLEQAFGWIAVEGELSNCRRWSSGHVYFTLKDDAAQLRGVMFRMRARHLRFEPEDGLRVIASGRLSLYDVKGEYQLVCETLEPHGIGALQAAFDQLKRRLQAEGLFEASRKRALPVLPRRIGVVTSRDGAALRDILRILTTRHPAARIVVRPARVQGEGAPESVVSALQAIQRVPDLDVVILGRGGGSAEDLWAFNDERVARAIAACPVPVISAVGHETDVTIADFVADVRAATPSNAAELVVDRADNFRGRIDGLTRRVRQAVGAVTDRHRRRIETGDLQLRQWPVKLVMQDRDIEERRLRLRQLLADAVARRGQSFERLRRRLEQRDVRRIAADIRTRLVHADGQLRAAITADAQAADAHVRELAGRLQSLSPLAVLGRGYAVCWNADRTGIIRSASTVEAGDGLHVTLASGELTCRVEASHPDRPAAATDKP